MNYYTNMCTCGHAQISHAMHSGSCQATNAYYGKCHCREYNEQTLINVPMQQAQTKDTNPKDAIASNKLPTSLVPSTLLIYATLGHLEGAIKYGKFNWRVAGVRLSVYLDALDRHMHAFKNGEWADPKTGVPHLANAISCLSIIVDSIETNKYIDDRAPEAAIGDLIRSTEKICKNIRDVVTPAEPPIQHTIKESKLGLGSKESSPKLGYDV